ncbi:MAG: universal stress protein [Reichenbachiella sp.]
MKNILLAVDLTSNDDLLINQGIQLSEKFDSKIWLIHIAAPDPDFVGYKVGPSYVRTTRAEELNNEHQSIQSMAQQIQNKNIEAEGLLIQGPTIEMIENEVKKLKIDLLILGSHRHGFLYETFVGHTSVNLINNLAIPILIVPLKEN